MSDITDSEKKKGFFNKIRGISCIPCRCKRQSYHKETKTAKENNIVTSNVIEDRRNFKFGSAGRHVSPDENGIFKTDGQVGSVETCDTGWGQSKITPEECKQRIEGTETGIEVIKKTIERLAVELNDLKLKTSLKNVQYKYGVFIS